MADLVVGLAKTVVEGALTKAQSVIEEEARLRQSAQHNLVFIAGEFEMMHSFLNVAKEERVRNNVVRTWVRQVRDLAYDVEDCIEFVVHLDNKPNWWRRLLPPCVSVVTLPLDEAVTELEKLKARVEDVSRRNSRYSLISDSGSKPVMQQQSAPSTAAGTTTLDMLVEARGTAKKQQCSWDLTQLITKGGSDLRVISVWGTGGDLGTMSIIRKAYQDPEISRNFTCRGWVKLTHPFHPNELLRSLVSQFYTNSCIQEGVNVDVDELKKMEEMTSMQGRLLEVFMEQVNKKRFLVVLENVSTMGEWDAVRMYLPDKKNGSLIIVSTQQCEIASLCIGQSYQVLELKQYSAEHSVCVFFKECSQGGYNGEETEWALDSGSEILTENQLSCMSGLPSVRIPTSKEKAAKDWMNRFRLVGRDSEMNELRNCIAKARLNAFQVMTVWGIAGVGKSALCRNLYFDRMLDKNQLFEKYCWVDLSHPFNLRDFCRSLLLDFHSGSLHSLGIKDHIQECRHILKEHRCLVVIDNLLSMEEWDSIQTALVSRPSSSIIIVITTEATIATHCADNEEAVFNVKGLEAEAAYKLFKKQSLSKNPTSPLKDSNDVELQELILKCGGLPKVIVAIADFLAPKTVKWMDSASSVNSRFMHELETNPEFHSLRELFGWMHSYFRTCPDFLKPCIFYLPVLPRDHSIRRRRLVRRWIAEGYSRDTGNTSSEERGEDFFSRLLDLSIIQQPPHSVTMANNDTRMVFCQINSFVREYIISRQMEENLVFELEGSCTLTTQRTGRHLVIRKSWDRDKIVFESIDFSRLRSLTVFGEWRSFFISDRMRLLRVLDLEDASGIKDKDLRHIMKLLSRLKYLSLRRCTEICRLPKSLGDLRQLETLDIRHTSVVTMPPSITKLKKLQYVRAGTAKPTPHNFVPWSQSVFCRRRELNGIEVPTGIGKVTALHTLGVVNVNSGRGKVILKELRKLTQLHKLGVSGINKSNSKEFYSAILGHAHLESLSVRLNTDNQDCLDVVPHDFLPPKNLQSLKLYGLVEKLPSWINQIHNLRKLDLDMTILADETISTLRDLKLCILRLKMKQFVGAKLNFCAILYGQQLRCYETVKILEISCDTNLDVSFGSQSLQNLELLKAHCCSGSRSKLQFSGLEELSELKEIQIKGSDDGTLKQDLERQLAMHGKNPVLKFL
ncbi:hypothetical protein ACP4OV_014955 [Aristida adscensionis]